MTIVCIRRPNRKKKRVFTCTDVNRIVRNIRESGESYCGDAELMSAILHGFGLQDVVCYFARVLAFFNRIKVFVILMYLLKVVKAVLLLYNMIYRGARNIIKAKTLLFIELELGVGWLSKLAIYGAELMAAIDILVGAIVIFISIFEKISGAGSFIEAICGAAGKFQTTVRVAEIAAVLLDEGSIIELERVENDVLSVEKTFSSIFGDLSL